MSEKIPLPFGHMAKTWMLGFKKGKEVQRKELIGEFRDKLIEYKKVLKDKWESGLMSGYVRIDMFLEFMEKEIKIWNGSVNE